MSSPNPQEKIGRYGLVTPAAEPRLPNPAQPLPAEWTGSIHAHFAQQARAEPSRLAIISPQGSWTYGELNLQSNRLAHYLRGRGILPQEVVAIQGPRCSGLAWAVLGVLKAGAAFLLLDPAYPEAWRLEQIRAARPRGWICLLSEGEPASPPVPTCPVTLELPVSRVAPRAALLRDHSTDYSPVVVGPDDLAYLAFTSGTSGKAKAIACTHRPLPHFFNWHVSTFGFTQEDRFAALSGLGHDPLLRDLFTPWWVGAAVCIPAEEPATASDVVACWLRDQHVTVLHLTPSLAGLMCQSADVSWPELRWAFFAGEPLYRADVARLRGRAPRCRCVNCYGATETPQVMAFHEVVEDHREDSPGSDRHILPLGRGIDGVQLLVLTGAGQLAETGEEGEIYVRTPYLARGYLNDEALTAARFVVNSFTQDPGDRLYRTGDLGRHLPDGNVEFVGRIDDQVKIRGVRIEPGEIEDTLKRHPKVLQAIVVAQKDVPGAARLVAYIVPHTGDTLLTNELRAHLRMAIPQYMVPSAFVLLDKLPLTANGKVDRSRLPAPTADRPDFGEGPSLPRTPTEEILLQIWSEVLKLSQVGIRENFFDLGGHSLLATQIVARIRQKLKVEVPLRTIFDNPTIEDLALALLEQHCRAAGSELLEKMLAELEGISKEDAQDQLLETDLHSPRPTAARTEHPPHAGLGDFRCQDTPSAWFGRRQCNLVVVINENFELAGFERVARRVSDFDPSITAVVVRDEPCQKLPLAALPTLIFAPALLRHRPPLQGRIFSGCPLSKSEEYAALQKAGIAVPDWVMLGENDVPDLSRFDGYVVQKPNYGGLGAEVRLVRKGRVRWRPITTRATGTSSSIIIQRFIFTGQRPVNYRVNTLFGKVLYSVKHVARSQHAELSGPDDLKSRKEVGSIVASARGSEIEPCHDEEIIRLGEAAHQAFPEIPLLGFDIVREMPTGRLYVLEANAIGYVWNFTARQPSEYGFSIEEQFDGVRKAAWILAEKTQQAAR